MITEIELSDIVIALNSGLVPRSGIKHIMVGREDELEQTNKELSLVSKGRSITKFFIGKFGTGKTFIQESIVQFAHDKNMITSKVDFSPYRRMYSRDGMALATYTEIIKNLKTKTSSENTIEIVIEEWINKLVEEVKKEEQIQSIDFTDASFIKLIEKKIVASIKKISYSFGATDFSMVLLKYFNGYISFDEETQKNAIRWISGEISTKTEAKQTLGVSKIIDDSNYYEFLKVLCSFVVVAGYNGLIIQFDEVVNLYKINNRPTRDKNYEMILRVFNDTIQGSIQNLYISFGGTEELLSNEYKGLYSYGALKRRLELNKYEDDENFDFAQPVIRLKPLAPKKQFELLKKIKNIYELYYKTTFEISDEEIIGFLKNNYSGIQKSVIIGNVVRDFVGALNIIEKNPGYDKSKIFEKVEKTEEVKEEEILSRFNV